MKKLLTLFVMFFVLLLAGQAYCADITLRFGWGHSDPADVTEWVFFVSEIQGGPYIEMGAVPNTPPDYVFTAPWTFQVQANTDKTYYFMARARDASGNESENSNEIFKRIDKVPPGKMFELTVVIEVVQ